MGGMIINHNMLAMNAARNLSTIYQRLSESTQRLSSGLRINSAADDAAGLAIRELMRADIAVLNQGLRNASDAISMIQTAEGALSVIDEKLTRMKELAEQASTGTYTTVQREIMNSEYQAMAAEIDRIANATDFNGVKLLDGSISQLHGGSGLKVHFGTGNDPDEDYYFISIADARATESTGLRVGGEGDQDIWQNSTRYDNLTDSVSTANGQYVSFWYNVDGDSTVGQTSAAAMSNPSNLVGIYQATSGMSLQGLIDQINDGTAARIQLNFQSSAGSSLIASAGAGQALQIGNTEIWMFGCAAAATASTSGDVQVALNSANDVATVFRNAINGYTSANVFAVRLDADSVLLYAKDAGVDGNSLQFTEVGGDSNDYAFVDISNGTSAGTTGNFTMGGLGWINAGAVYDGTYWHMNVTGAELTQDYDVWVQDIVDLTLGASAWATTLDNFYQTDWEETQHASGTANWAGLHIRTQSAAQAALAQLDDAIVAKDVIRANLGALQNRLENTITNLEIQAEMLQAAESRISDVDMATEMTEFTKNNILAQAATAMLAQANSLPQLALTLLG